MGTFKRRILTSFCPLAWTGVLPQASDTKLRSRQTPFATTHQQPENSFISVGTVFLNLAGMQTILMLVRVLT